MSTEKAMEVLETGLATEPEHAGQTPGPAPEPEKAASRRAYADEFYNQGRASVLSDMGENPGNFLRLMDSLKADLQPQGSLETHLVEQMGETLWRIKRTQRMQEGMGRKSVQARLQIEMAMATRAASEALDKAEPFARLQKALARLSGPTIEQVNAFIKSQSGNKSHGMQEFIKMLNSLLTPREETERKALRSKVRAELRTYLEGYQSAFMAQSRQVQQVQSAENQAALMAPHGQVAMYLQRIDDSNVRRLCELTKTLAKVREGALTRRNFEKGVRSWNVVENTRKSDIMSENKSDLMSENAEILQKNVAL